MNPFTKYPHLPALLRVLTHRPSPLLTRPQITRLLELGLWLLLGVVWAAPAMSQRVWTTRTSAADNNWQSVAHGNGLFVAVANSTTGDRVMTSPDGITWTVRAIAISGAWQSVTYGNGLFVAVGGTSTSPFSGFGRIMTSPDGITWTNRSVPSLGNLISVTYGNGRFVAVSWGGAGTSMAATSPDGITWTGRTVQGLRWRSVIYGNGLFVAVGSEGAGAMYSSDGITWTRRSVYTGDDWFSVTYGKGLFVAVAVAYGTNRVMTSPDGYDWTLRTPANTNGWFSVTYGDGLFVAVGNTGTGNRVMTSPNGINWTARTSAADNNWYSVTYGNGLFVAVATSGTGNRVMTSPYDNSLPVTLTYFNGRMVAEGALLGWATAREANSSHFLLERSRDLQGFEAIAHVPSRATNGNATTELTYSYTDTQLLPGINYYRLVQVDLDGTRTPSRPVALSREGQQPVLYPNPVGTSGEAQLEPAVGYVRYRLTNLLGQVVQQADAPGTLSRVSVAGQPSGLYLLQVETPEGASQTYRIVK